MWAVFEELRRNGYLAGAEWNDDGSIIIRLPEEETIELDEE